MTQRLTRSTGLGISVSLLFKIIVPGLLSVLLMFIMVPRSQADSPVIKVVREKNGCVSNAVGDYDSDMFTRIGLSSEVASAWVNVWSMKAQAVLIRGIGWYHRFIDPEWNDPGIRFCAGVTPFYFDLRDTRIAFAPRKSSGYYASNPQDPNYCSNCTGNAINRPNDRVTDTMGQIVRRYGDQKIYFNKCIQNLMNAVTYQYSSPDQILTAVYGNPGSCASLPPCNNYDPVYHCTYPDLQFQMWPPPYAYHPSAPGKSMMNGARTAVPPVGGPSNLVTTPGQTRQAEVYWGVHMGLGQTSPFGQPGTYIIGPGHADMVEYLLAVGGAYRHLYVNAISDRPGPVDANIYVDGYYNGMIRWQQADNSRHLGHIDLGDMPYGVHVIAIQFSEALFGSSPDQERKLYLDDLGVAATLVSEENLDQEINEVNIMDSSVGQLATYQGESGYLDLPLFEVAYDPQQWSIERDPSAGSLEKPAHKLINAQIPACTLFLREGPREFLGFGSAVLGGRTWRIDIHPPDRLIYSILYENGGFLFAVGLPPGGTEAQRNDCKEQAETVLATFEVLR